MAQTYAQIQKQIEQLQRQADAIRNEEIKGVIDRIKVAITHYGLTADQLGLGRVESHPATAAKATPSGSSTKASRTKGKPRFSDRLGNAWTGMGPKPAWLREALSAGHHINEFRIGNRVKPKNLVPLAAAAAPAAAPATATAAASRPGSKARYSDNAGNSWSGMGPKPGWVKKAIESGRTLADLAK